MVICTTITLYGFRTISSRKKENYNSLLDLVLKTMAVAASTRKLPIYKLKLV